MALHEDKMFLEKWLRNRLVDDERFSYACSKAFHSLSIVAYFYRNEIDEDEAFPITRAAIMETWRKLGLLRTVIVTNRLSNPVSSFLTSWPHVVTVQVEPTLRPGTTDDLSIDCLTRLGDRFDTDYVLTVQDDGFPIRSGIERFIGKWDFIGAPYRRANLLGWCAGTLFKHWPSNGGFSLRSKRICRHLASTFDKEWYSRLSTPDKSEDLYITHVLPRIDRSFAREFRVANSYVAASFAYDGALPSNVKMNPLGFHNAKAFRELHEKGLVV